MSTSAPARTIAVIDLANRTKPASGQVPVRHQVRLAHRRLAGQPLLLWVVRRASDAEGVENVVCIQHPDDAPIDEFLPPDVSVFRSSESSELQRMAEACRAFDASSAVRLRLDCPFVDPSLIERLIAAGRFDTHCDYVAFHNSDDNLVSSTRCGFFAEWYRSQFLHSAAASGITELEFECLTQSSGGFAAKFLGIPHALSSNLRLRLDDAEAWERAEQVIELLGVEAADWQEISRLLSSLQQT